LKKPLNNKSISFIEPNDEWMKNQIDLNEYSSKIELAIDLIRQAASQQLQNDLVRVKINNEEKSGFTSDKY
jgi:antitoxin ParD1/3/4